jgi:voltage-gated potassium channel Kch
VSEERDRTGTGAPTGVRAPLRLRLRYAFDNSMARGLRALVLLLVAAVAAMSLVSAALVLILGVGPTHNPITAAYRALMHMIDTGNQANDVGTTYSVIDLGVTLFGILVVSAFIGVLVTTIEARLSQLRKGRSVVLEDDHTLILGWSERVFTILSELSVANESRERPSVVILAERDKVEMEEAIRERVSTVRNTRVVCRTGRPIVLADLKLANHSAARSVIIVSDESAMDPDAEVIKTILALTSDLDACNSERHIVAEIYDAENLHAAELAGKGTAVLVDKVQTVSRLIVQTSRESGAAAVYKEMLDFAGDEIYMRRDVRLAGLSYLGATLAYETCAVIGLMHADGIIELNPPADKAVAETDCVIALAEDDSVLEVAEHAPSQTEPKKIALRPLVPRTAESVLVLGYNHKTPLVVSELAEYAQSGSCVDVVADVPVQLDELVSNGAINGRLACRYIEGKTTDRRVLEELLDRRYDRVIVMSYSDHLDSYRADARSLVTLLHLRDIAGDQGFDFRMVSEIQTAEDSKLAEVASVDDIVVSEEVLSLLLTQISENKHLAEVFRLLLQADGPEVYLRPVELYVRPGPLTFATLIEAASARAETAIGYWRKAGPPNRSPSDLRINPSKGTVFNGEAGDRLIVLAED